MAPSACGSSKSSRGATGTTGTSGGTTSASSSGASQDVATAQKIVTQAEEAPRSLTGLTSLKAAPAKGKVIVYVQCQLTQCVGYGDGLQAAATAVGWTLKRISFQSGNAQTLLAGFQQALTDHPVAVSEAGEPLSELQSILPAYSSAGVPIIPIGAGAITYSKTIPIEVASQAYYIKVGSVVANWFIADSKGAGQTLIVGTPAFPTQKALAGSIASIVAKGCSKCKTTMLNTTLDEIGTNGVVPSIVSALRRSPSIRYVLVNDGTFVPGLPAAITAAGIHGIKIAGWGADSENEQDLANGTEAAWGSFATNVLSWQIVDAAARITEGMLTEAADGVGASQLLTPANVRSIGEYTDSVDLPKNYANEYKQLWHVG